MYQDTVKYVENQVQTVGVSVKKFYSDVVQDLVPPSCIDPVKVAAADLSLNPYADFGIYKKPKASIKKDTIKREKEVTKDSKVISGANTDHSSFSGLHNVDRGFYEHSNVPVKRKSTRNNNLPSEILRSTTPPSKDLSRVSSCHEISENHEVACDQIAMISCPATVGVTGCDSSVAKFCDNIAGSTASKDDTSIDIPKSKMILPVESGAKKETKLRCTSSNCGSDVLSAELNGMNSGVVSLIESYISGDPHYSESASEDYFSPTGRSGDCNIDVIENSDCIVDLEMETIEQFESQSWKKLVKKIQKALSSKRSARKQEYKQLAEQHGDIDVGSNQGSAEIVMLTYTTDADADADAKKPPSHGVCESEWELL
ncbi:hypothetical protein LOK49_LG07G02055 [Camellia lanceoleosa]|uniref:Uncharacterized protein n=1 Tax=Camellia lanceoleosa TaxID=1840588 RepID=A0ACC0H8K2_9ERIC|nr:hypothetical protein LOK49_LG07G02055 [Camellia lanceoleosa]